MNEYDLLKVRSNNLIEFYRNNPVIAVADLLNVELAPVQRIIFRDMWFKDYVIVVACRGLGKSFLQACLAALKAILYPGHRIGLIGSSFRQAKVIFREIEALYQRSPILREASTRGPVKSTDMCELRLRPAGKFSGSAVCAIPLGSDGSKIRGQRFFTICADEFAQIPEQIFNLVVKPMGATSSDPIENVKKIARRKKLKELGVDIPDDTINNKIVMTSSGYFKVNHMWSRMRYYWKKIAEGDKAYAVHQAAHWDLPEGFLNKSNIDEARANMPKFLFEMEYCGAMVAESSGFYKSSVIEACVANKVDNYFTVKPVGSKGAEYIMGIDPARVRDSFAILIFEICEGFVRIVYATTYTGKDSLQTVEEIFRLRDKFKLSRIIMDSQGGGFSIKDLLQAGQGGHRPILDILDTTNYGRDGDLILQLFNPSPSTNTEANFAALNMLENTKLLFPGPPQHSVEEEDDIYEHINTLKRQILTIAVTTNPNGTLNFNTQSAKSKKDLYSCFIMGCWVIRQLEKEAETPLDQEILLSHGGIINPRGGSSYNDRMHLSRLNNFDGTTRPLIVPNSY